MRAWAKWGLVLLLTAATSLYAAEHSVGVGVHYWRTVKDIDVMRVDEDGLAWVLSYQYAPSGLLRVEIDLERIEQQIGEDARSLYAPQALILVGSGIYAGLGVGMLYADNALSNSPFYSVRAGLRFDLLPSLVLDVTANYRFVEWKGLNDIMDEIDTDTVTLGAFVRLSF